MAGCQLSHLEECFNVVITRRIWYCQVHSICSQKIKWPTIYTESGPLGLWQTPVHVIVIV